MSHILVFLLVLCLSRVCADNLCEAAKRMPAFYVSPISKVIKLTEDKFHEQVQQPDNVTWMVEFYAQWSPGCQRYQKHYDILASKVAAWGSSLVQVAAVSCVCEPELCAKFKIADYPEIRLFTPGQKTKSGNLGTELSREEDLLGVLRKHAGKIATGHKGLRQVATHRQLDSKEYWYYPQTLAQGAPKPSIMHDVLASISFNLQHDIVRKSGAMSESLLRQLLHWLQFLGTHLPHPKAKAALAKMKRALGDKSKWTKDDYDAVVKETILAPNTGFESKPTWKVCRGDHRGYTCGLWMTFHALMVQQPPHAGVDKAVLVLRNFVAHLLKCDNYDCRKNFLEMTKNDKTLAAGMNGPIWLWWRHNQLNMKLSSEEYWAGRTNPLYAKRVVPTVPECPKCWLQEYWPDRFELVDFNLTKVHHFLTRVYCIASDNEANTLGGYCDLRAKRQKIFFSDFLLGKTTTTIEPAKKGNTWKRIGLYVKCNTDDGEKVLDTSSNEESIEACKDACFDDEKCQSITLFKTGWCAHYSTSCTNTKGDGESQSAWRLVHRRRRLRRN